jgi:hypothetical protein
MKSAFAKQAVRFEADLMLCSARSDIRTLGKTDADFLT